MAILQRRRKLRRERITGYYFRYRINPRINAIYGSVADVI
jgi:hypothetical protein